MRDYALMRLNLHIWHENFFLLPPVAFPEVHRGVLGCRMIRSAVVVVLLLALAGLDRGAAT
jgi:hypothetical protein